MTASWTRSMRFSNNAGMCSGIPLDSSLFSPFCNLELIGHPELASGKFVGFGVFTAESGAEWQRVRELPVDQGGDVAVLVDEYVHTVEIVMGNKKQELGKLIRPPGKALNRRLISEDVFQRRYQVGV